MRCVELTPVRSKARLLQKYHTRETQSAQRVFVPTLAQINERGGTMRRVANLSGFDDEGREMLSSFEKWRLVVTNGDQRRGRSRVIYSARGRDFSVGWNQNEHDSRTLRSLESAAASGIRNARGYDFVGQLGGVCVTFKH